MEIDVTQEKAKIDFSPKTIREEVTQNVRMILGTIVYSVPNDRGFALNGEYLDNPIDRNLALCRKDITEAIHSREPRARVKTIKFQGDAMQGALIPVVRIEINA